LQLQYLRERVDRSGASMVMREVGVLMHCSLSYGCVFFKHIT